MTNPFTLLFQPSYLGRIPARAAMRSLRKFPIIRVLSTLAVLAGLTAFLAGCSSNEVSESPEPIPTISAESLSTEQIENYAKAVLAIDSSRQTAYEEILQISNNESIPNIDCRQTETIRSLERSIQDIAVNYCNKAKEIGESHGLTIGQFNAITKSANEDADLLKRIQNELVRLQQSSAG